MFPVLLGIGEGAEHDQQVVERIGLVVRDIDVERERVHRSPCGRILRDGVEELGHTERRIGGIRERRDGRTVPGTHDLGIGDLDRDVYIPALELSIGLEIEQHHFGRLFVIRILVSRRIVGRVFTGEQDRDRQDRQHGDHRIQNFTDTHTAKPPSNVLLPGPYGPGHAP